MAIITLENAVLVRMANQALINALAGEVESTENDMSAYAIYRELSRNRRVGQRERGLYESFSLVSPYSSVAKPRGLWLSSRYCITGPREAVRAATVARGRKL